MRGKHVTKPIEEVIAEAQQLAADGVRELIIVAQDTTYYGMDLYGRPRLAELLQQLDQVDGLDWIRLMYFYPMYIDDALIDTLASSRRIVPYLDMPLQHINDTMLKRMARRVSRAETEALLDQLRGPDRGPGAAHDVHHRLSRRDGRAVRRAGRVRRAAEVRTDGRVHLFAGTGHARRRAARSGTGGSRRGPPRPLDGRCSRRSPLRGIEQQVGRCLDVILDTPVAGQRDVWIGRSQADAPDVDGLVYVTGKRLQAGQIVPCEIVTTQDYDLVGAAVNEPARSR